MKARLMVRLGAVVFAIGLVGSSALAAKLETVTSSAEQTGSCAAECRQTATDTLDETYPAYQPLEVCDDVCIFY